MKGYLLCCWGRQNRVCRYDRMSNTGQLSLAGLMAAAAQKCVCTYTSSLHPPTHLEGHPQHPVDLDGLRQVLLQLGHDEVAVALRDGGAGGWYTNTH